MLIQSAKNHLPGPIAEKDILASYTDFLPPNTPPVFHIPVFDYTLFYTLLKLIKCVHFVSLKANIKSYTTLTFKPISILLPNLVSCGREE